MHTKIVRILMWRVDGALYPTGEEFYTTATSIRSAIRSLSTVHGWDYCEGDKQAWEKDGVHRWTGMRVD